MIPPVLSRFRYSARSGTRPLRPRSLRPSVIPVLGRSRRSLAVLALAATLALTWVRSCARRLRSSTAPVLGFFSSRLPSAGLLQRSAYSTLALIHCGDTLDRHPRLGALPIGHFGSDPLGSDVLRSVSLDQTPSAWTLSHRPPSARSPGSAHSDSATPGAARSHLTYDLGRFWRFGSRPLQISAASALGRSNPQPLRSSATPPLWCSTCPALGHFGTHLLVCLFCVLFVASVIAHRCSNFWCSAALVIGSSAFLVPRPLWSLPVPVLASFQALGPFGLSLCFFVACVCVCLAITHRCSNISALGCFGAQLLGTLWASPAASLVLARTGR